MTLKQAELYDSGDRLEITSSEAPKDKPSETIYITDAEWDVLLMIDREFIQDALLDILEEERDLKNSEAYIKYKERLSNVLCPTLKDDVAGALEVKRTYLNSKTVTYRTRVILELLDEIIYTNA